MTNADFGTRNLSKQGIAITKTKNLWAKAKRILRRELVKA